MNFIASNLVGQGTQYTLSKPNWGLPTALKEELRKAKLGYNCFASDGTKHEILGESCGLALPSDDSGLTCDDLWVASVAAEWPIESLGEWLCGQGHEPVSITVDKCPTKGCPIIKQHLPEIAARSWISVTSRE